MIAAILFNGLLQGPAIVALTYLTARCVPERNATTRHAVWCAALLALLIVPALTIVSNAGAHIVAALRPSQRGTAPTVSLIPVGTLTHAATHLAPSLAGAIIAVWLCGFAIQACRLAASFLRIRRIRRNAVTFDCCGERVLISSELAVPIAAGLREPVVIIPKSVVERSARRRTYSASSHTSTRTFGATTSPQTSSNVLSKRCCSSIPAFTSSAAISSRSAKPHATIWPYSKPAVSSSTRDASRRCPKGWAVDKRAFLRQARSVCATAWLRVSSASPAPEPRTQQHSIPTLLEERLCSSQCSRSVFKRWLRLPLCRPPHPHYRYPPGRLSWPPHAACHTPPQK